MTTPTTVTDAARPWWWDDADHTCGRTPECDDHYDRPPTWGEAYDYCAERGAGHDAANTIAIVAAAMTPTPEWHEDWHDFCDREMAEIGGTQ